MMGADGIIMGMLIAQSREKMSPEEIADRIIKAFEDDGFAIGYWDSWKGFGGFEKIDRDTLIRIIKGEPITSLP